MTVMWSTVSFCGYLLTFMNKYLEGSIFTNNYVEGLAGGLSVIIGASLYKKLGMRRALVFSFGLSLIGGGLVYLLEADAIDLPTFFL